MTAARPALYAIPSSRGTRVTILLEELGIDYDYHPMMPGTPQARSLHCMGKTPVLKDGDLTLIESAAICTWLAQRYPDAGLLPEQGTRERAEHDQFLFFVVNELEEPLWTLGRHSFVYPEQMRVEAIKPVARQEFARAIEGFEQLLDDRQYAVGDRFTVADVIAGHTLGWAQRAKCEVTSDTVLAYRERVRSRPSFARAAAREKAAGSQ
jgi:glutathione S-transferase